MNRMVELLRAAADTMEQHSDPFHGSFLVEHNVTFDEVMTLSELLAMGARLVAKGIETPRVAAAALNAASLAEITEALRGIRRVT